MDGDDQYLVARAVSAQDTAAFGELIRRHPYTRTAFCTPGTNCRPSRVAARSSAGC